MPNVFELICAKATEYNAKQVVCVNKLKLDSLPIRRLVRHRYYCM